ncbi:MAG: murein biosynthesis integral membrane protein MurJ [Rickettsiales bacterium]|jgi:putative peptidoglycan lipid II flippase|nr:murein biosynthesis integral membrane protein MurJ [Rickettsiales bacterium]
MSLSKKIFGVGAWTAASRVLGFARDVLIGRVLGAGRLSDIFLAAFKLPNLFRDLLGEGAMSSVFIPMFSREKKSADFAANALAWLLVILLALTLLFEIFMPLVMLGIAPGFDAEKMAAAVHIGRVMFVYIILVCSAGFLSAILNAFSDFAVAAAVPLVLNVALILSVLSFGADLTALAVAVLIAGVVQIAILAARLRRRNFGLKLVRPRWNPLIKTMTRRMGWGFLGSGFYQLNVIVGVIVASYQSGAVSWLYYADRMVQLPFAVVGLAAGTILLTKISDAISADKMDAVGKYQSAAMRQSLMFILPAMFGLIALSEPMIRFLFERGAWTADATTAVAMAIMIGALALPAMTTSQIYLKTIYASGDAKTPVKVGAITLGFGVAVMVALAPEIGYLAVPVGTLASGLCRNFWLRRICVRRGLWRGRANVGAFWVLSLAMGAGLWFARPMITGLIPLAIAIAAAAIIYLPSALFCDKIAKKN